MGFEDLAAVPRGGLSTDPPDAAETKSSYKSYRKKFRKLKLHFDLSMKESEALFREERKACETTKRLVQENDQLLELLLDINESNHIPPHQRFDLGSPASSPLPSHAVPALDFDDDTDSETSYDSVAARNALDEAREEVANGEMTEQTYNQLRAEWEAKATKKHGKDHSEPKPFHAVLSTPHTSVPASREDLPEGLHSSDSANPLFDPPFLLTPTTEEDYLYTLDASLSNSPPIVPRQLSSNGNASAGLNSSKSVDRDLQTRNPVSVYNWLRRHQPQVFLQDNEHAGGDGASSTKSGPTGAAGRSAHPRGAKETPKRSGVIKTEANDDEDWNIVEPGGTLTGRRISGGMKRKRTGDDDPGYRPKGGSSRASTKRKREDGGSSGHGKKVRKIYAASSNGA